MTRPGLLTILVWIHFFLMFRCEGLRRGAVCEHVTVRITLEIELNRAAKLFEQSCFLRFVPPARVELVREEASGDDA